LKMKDRDLIKCRVCGKRFPVTTWKRPYRKVIFCPWCRTPYTNSFFDPEWKPNLKWHEGKHRSRPFTIADMRRALSRMLNVKRMVRA